MFYKKSNGGRFHGRSDNRGAFGAPVSDGPSARRVLATVLGIAGIAVLTAVLLALLAIYDPSEWASGHVYFEALYVVLVGYLVAKALGAAVARYLGREGRVRQAPLVRIVADIIIYALVAAAILSLVGVSAQNLFFGSAFAGIILGLAGQTVFANVLSGVVIALTAPYRPGERIAIISSNYGIVSSTYAHERAYPSYTGTVVDLGLIYTQMRLDDGRPAKIPNAVLLQAMVVGYGAGAPRLQRVRMTFPLSVPVAEFERAAAAYRAAHRPPSGRPDAWTEVADVGTSSWDGVLALWTTEPSEESVRDAVLRQVLGSKVPAAPAAPDWSEGGAAESGQTAK